MCSMVDGGHITLRRGAEAAVGVVGQTEKQCCNVCAGAGSSMWGWQAKIALGKIF